MSRRRLFQTAKSFYYEGFSYAVPIFCIPTSFAGIVKGVNLGFQDNNEYRFPLYLVGGFTAGMAGGVAISPFYPAIIVGGTYIFVKGLIWPPRLT